MPAEEPSTTKLPKRPIKPPTSRDAFLEATFDLSRYLKAAQDQLSAAIAVGLGRMPLHLCTSVPTPNDSPQSLHTELGLYFRHRLGPGATDTALTTIEASRAVPIHTAQSIS
jgi:hypothetical protein